MTVLVHWGGINILLIQKRFEVKNLDTRPIIRIGKYHENDTKSR